MGEKEGEREGDRQIERQRDTQTETERNRDVFREISEGKREGRRYEGRRGGSTHLELIAAALSLERTPLIMETLTAPFSMNAPPSNTQVAP